MNKPALLLLPNLIADLKHHELFLPASVDKAVATLDGLIAESESEGRRYLSRFNLEKPVHLIPIALYTTNTSDADLDFLLEPIAKGERWGLVSDSGLPCVADPGSKLVLRARQRGIQIQAFVGPSSIMMALMLSGLPGQHFSFHAYLDRDPGLFRAKMKKLETKSREEDATQIFMEPPYRNMVALNAILEALHEETLLSVAWDLTMPTQAVLTQSVKLWKKSPLPNLEKRNALFLIYKQKK
jgi:16S rRNA (cytidine1402-2'-O)-methyltransferase